MSKQSPLSIAITGSTGFVGSYLQRAFKENGWLVIQVLRDDLKRGAKHLAERMSGCGVVVNLAGAPVVGRWSKKYKKVLYNSRIETTSKLVEAFGQMDKKPHTFISTSAIGYYSSKGKHTEANNSRALNFLGDLAQAWEIEALNAENQDIRTIIFRFGVVLGKGGGPLQKMLPPFKLGLGGKIGSGTQAFSWIHIKDLSRAYITVINSPSFSGIYNLTAPQPTTNTGMTKALGKVLNKPTILPIPETILRLLYGEGAQVLTEGQHVTPQRLLNSGFKFSFNDIEKALRDCV